MNFPQYWAHVLVIELGILIVFYYEILVRICHQCHFQFFFFISSGFWVVLILSSGIFMQHHFISDSQSWCNTLRWQYGLRGPSVVMRPADMKVSPITIQIWIEVQRKYSAFYSVTVFLDSRDEIHDSKSDFNHDSNTNY